MSSILLRPLTPTFKNLAPSLLQASLGSSDPREQVRLHLVSQLISHLHISWKQCFEWRCWLEDRKGKQNTCPSLLPKVLPGWPSPTWSKSGKEAAN